MRQQSHARRPGFVSGVVAGLLVFLVGLGAWWYGPLSHIAGPNDPITRQPEGSGQPVNILVLGVDERLEDTGRSDTILLVRLEQGASRVLAIPRDTLVSMGDYGEGKANSAYTYGGADLARRAVSELLGVPVQYYVKVNLSGFRHLVDLMGGVTFDVPKPMHYVDPTDHLVIDLQPGRQLLDGAKAEQFVRFRHDAIGDDVGRIQRQQEFLKAAATQALTPAKLPLLPQLLYAAGSYIDTDLPVSQQLRLLQELSAAKQRDAIVQETLPGHGEYLNGVSFFLPDQEALQRLSVAFTAPSGSRSTP